MSLHRSFIARSESSLAAPKPLFGEGGFTLVELMMVVAIAAVGMALTMAVSPYVLKTAKADSGLIQAMDALRFARETAISQRRNVFVQFNGTNIIQLVRQEIDGNNQVAGTTVIRTVPLENRLRFLLITGQPDTPDAFGRTTPTSFSSTTRVFTTEGSFVDGQGNPMNGTLFLAVPGEPNTARAITFFGPTALLRGWKWDGKKWVE